MSEHHRNPNSAIQRVAVILTCALAFTLLAPPRAADAQDAFSCIEELSDDVSLEACLSQARKPVIDSSRAFSPAEPTPIGYRRRKSDS